MGSETGKRGSVVGLSTRGTRDWKARCGGTVDTWDQRPESELVWWDCQTRRTRLLLPAVRTSKTFSRSDYRHVFQTDRIAMSVGLNSRRYVGQRNDAWHPGIHWPARNLSVASQRVLLPGRSEGTSLSRLSKNLLRPIGLSPTD